MIYTEKTRKALDLCFRAHKDQTDKAGAPYVFHPFYVADRMTEGCNMGVKSLSKYLNQYRAASEEAKGLCCELITLEEKLAKDIRCYL